MSVPSSRPPSRLPSRSGTPSIREMVCVITAHLIFPQNASSLALTAHLLRPNSGPRSHETLQARKGIRGSPGTPLDSVRIPLITSPQIFRQQVGHQPKGIVPQTVNPVSNPALHVEPVTDPLMSQDEETVPGIEHPGSTGVIYCSDRAMANGFSYANSHEWANLGQGAPEVGPIPNALPRPDSIPMPVDSLEYAPTTGVRGSPYPVSHVYLCQFLSQHSEKQSLTCTTTHTVRERQVSTRTRTSV